MSRKNNQKPVIKPADVAPQPPTPAAPTIDPPAGEPVVPGSEPMTHVPPETPAAEGAAILDEALAKSSDVFAAGPNSGTGEPPEAPEYQPPANPSQDEEPPAMPPEPADKVSAERQREPSIDDVLPKLDLSQPPVGYVQRKPNPRLSPDEAHAQAHLFAKLVKQGLPLKDQGGVYPWLLRQVRKAAEH